MKNNFFRLTSSDSIRAQIQKEEIEQIIHRQQSKKDQNSNTSTTHIVYPQKTPQKDSPLRKTSAFSIRKTRIKQPTHRQSRPPQQAAQSPDLRQQIDYFSVKKRYDRIINSSFDQQLINQLRLELEPVGSARYSQQLEKRGDSANFFQKVFKRSNKIQQYFQEIRRTRRQNLSASEEICFR